MPPLWIADAMPTGEWNGTLTGIIAVLLGALGWFTRQWLVDLREGTKQALEKLAAAIEQAQKDNQDELRRGRITTEENTKVVAMSLLAVAHLTPGSQPILEKIKEGAERRMQGGTP